MMTENNETGIEESNLYYSILTYVKHRQRVSATELEEVFARGQKKRNGVTVPFTYLGPVERVSFESERPIKMVWKLRHQMTVEMFEDNRRGG